jgi:hypothetical protein
MKKLLVVLLFTISGNLFSQSSSKDEVAIIQSIYGKSKTDIVSGAMELTAAETAAFQPIYDSYEEERKALGRKKLEIINDYVENYNSLTAEKADALMKANLKNNLDVEKLLAKTYEKVKKAIGATNAVKFIQLEIFFQTTIRMEIQDNIPFIGEIEKLKTN